MKIAVLAAAASIALTGLGTATASAQELPGTVTVHNATQFSWNDEALQYFCTIAAVGKDKYERNIGITAGHCIGYLEHPLDQVDIAGDDSLSTTATT